MSSNKLPDVAGYKLVRTIGGGGFSTVYFAANVADHRVAACKHVVFTEQTTEKERKTVEKEMRVHSALKHPNVLEFLNAVVVELKHRHLYVPGIYMMLELAGGGDLFDKIAPDMGIGEDVAHIYFGQLLDGMNYIHAQGVCHRDLKPENLLLDAAGRLKISDFGLSSVFMLKESGKTRTLTERCGSLPYVAPELNGKEPYNAEPIDVWGMGVILFTMLAGNTPWDEPTHHSPEFMRYMRGEIFSEEPWNRIGTNVMSLIKGLLCIDPAERLTIGDAYAHPWVMRQSQLASQGPSALAEQLTQGLHASGDMDYASPPLHDQSMMGTDEDGDQMMMSATAQSQFTQSLQLFSQTQSGVRYTPSLTRFYASLPPGAVYPLVFHTLDALGARVRDAAPVGEKLRMRVGGRDARNEEFLGWVEIEMFTYRGAEGSFCVMVKEKGNPISWRQLWKALIVADTMHGYVLRK